MASTILKGRNLVDIPKGPNLEKNQDRLKFSISLEIFNPDLQNSPQKIGVWWVARLKISSSLENFKTLNIFKIWALRDFGYFLFFLLGGGEGDRGARKGVRGVGFLLKITGGGARREGEGGGAEGLGGCLWGIGGGGG